MNAYPVVKPSVIGDDGVLRLNREGETKTVVGGGGRGRSPDGPQLR